MIKTLLTNIKLYFHEYCSHSSVHGVQYFGEKKRTIFERIWWTIVFTISLTACVVSILAVYKKWEESPVIVNFANKKTGIFEIPFPAVTICPETNVRQDRFNFTKIMHKKEDGIPLTTEEDTNFEYMSLLCNNYLNLHYSWNETFSDDFYNLIDELQPNFKLASCSFFGDLTEQCQLVPIITDQGICYTINMIDRSDIYQDRVVHFKNFHKFESNNSWSFQDGYAKNSVFDVYPKRAWLAGAKYGFTVFILTPADNLDYACKNVQGYRVSVHSPVTIPRPSSDYFRIPLDYSVMANILPTMITTSKRVQTYSPEKRMCYFPKERSLRYFKIYSASNCDLECFTNFTLATCNCVDYYMPRENGTKLCGTGKLDCIRKAEQFMQILDVGVKLKEFNSLLYRKMFNLTVCNCLPSCSDLLYDVEVSQTGWDWRRWGAARRLPNTLGNMTNPYLSSLTLFFKSDSFITTERNELYGPLDFLANFGGLLGLFTGFSVLSLMEILYFLSIRIVCNLRLFQQLPVPESKLPV